MAHDSIVMKYNGFYPSENTRDFLLKIMNEIKRESPAGSRVISHITRKNKIFKAMVEVHSAAGPFFVSSSSASLKEVSDKLLFLMRKRLNKWRDKRNRYNSLKDIMTVLSLKNHSRKHIQNFS